MGKGGVAFLPVFLGALLALMIKPTVLSFFARSEAA